MSSFDKTNNKKKSSCDATEDHSLMELFIADVYISVIMGPLVDGIMFETDRHSFVVAPLGTISISLNIYSIQ